MSKPLISLIESVFEDIKSLFEDRLDLLKLRVIDKVSKFFASVITGLFLAMAFIIFITVFNIGIALYIGECTGKTYIGFLSVAAFYAVAGIILFLGRRTLIRSTITGILIKKITRYGHRRNK